MDDEILDSMIYEVYGTNGWKQAATSATTKDEDEMCGGGTSHFTSESFGNFGDRVMSEDEWPMSDGEQKKGTEVDQTEIEVK